jgi:polysaccharide biosynthesis transport protein
MSPLDPTNPATPPRAPRPAPVRDAEALMVRPADGGGPIAVPPGLSAVPTAGALLGALGRRWFLALLLGLLVASLAGFALWSLVPAPYVSEVRLQILRPPLYMPGYTEADDDYRRGQVSLLKSRTVLDDALNDSKIKGLPIIAEQPDPNLWLAKELSVKFITGENFVTLKVGGATPQTAADLLGAMVRAYKAELVATRKGRQKRLESDRIEVGRKIRELGGGGRLFDPNQLLNARSNWQRFREQLVLARADLKSREGKWKPPSDEAVDIDAEKDLRDRPEVVDLRKRIAEKEEFISKYARASGLGRDDPGLATHVQEVVILQTRLDSYRQKARARARATLDEQARANHELALAPLRVQIAGLVAQEQIALSEMHEYERLDTPEARALATRYKVLNKLYEQIEKDIEEINLAGDEVPWVKELGKPTEPRLRDRDKQIKFTALGSLGAFGLALFGVALVEFRSRRVSSAEDVAIGLGIPTVGTLPALPARVRRAALTSNATRDTWQNRLTESVDALRTFLLRALGDGPHVILVTSALPGEGKTSLASQLAASLARAWRKTLLVDGDLRKPAAHRLFDVPVEPGLCEVLRGDLELSDVIRPTAVGRLWVMPAGQWDAHALQALAQEEALDHLFNYLKEDYEFVIVDSCPVLPVPDTLMLGQHADTVLLSVMRGSSRLPAVYSARQRLGSLDIPVLGAVVVGTNSPAGGLHIQYPRPSGGNG